MPSGLFCDKATVSNSGVFCAEMVYTFENAKLALLLPLSANYAKGFEIVDIQLDQETKNKLQTNYYYTRKNWVKQQLKVPNKFAHKGILGHGLIIGGSYSKIGAVALASKAALKTGCGLVSAYLPSVGYSILQSSLWEVMCLTDKQANYLTDFPPISQYTAIGVGPGMGTHEQTEQAFLKFLNKISDSQVRLVLDADALNILSQNKEYLAYLPKNTILTPHPKELERLIGGWDDDFAKIQKVKEIAKKYQVIFIVKGAHSEVVLPNGDVYFNSTGNWALASGGSGDVLTGMIVSLLAQGYSSDLAAILGVYLHGKAADCCVLNTSGFSVTASDVINAISLAYQQVLYNR
ncbi:NAD(P)H-hydrate dehydratase [Myroides sp. LJL110]